MIIRKKGGRGRARIWVYFEIASDLALAIRDQSPRMTREDLLAWFNANCEGCWQLDATCRHLRGHENDFAVAKFELEDDAHLFNLTFSGQASSSRVPPKAKTSWTQRELTDPKALTFSKTNSVWWYRAPVKLRGPLKGRQIRYCYSTERNAAGYFLGWREIDGRADRESYHARRKKKAVIAWAKRHAGC